MIPFAVNDRISDMARLISDVTFFRKSLETTNNPEARALISNRIYQDKAKAATLFQQTHGLTVEEFMGAMQ